MTRWLILRTGGGQTLPLMASLQAAGFEAWTPARTIRKVLRAGKRTEQRTEVEVPILPSYVFAREADMPALATAARAAVSPFPAFSLFQHDGRIPLIGDGQVQGLRDEEAKHAAEMTAMRQAETHAEAERIRIDSLKTAAAKRRATWALDKARITALRTRGRDLTPGAEVLVENMPAMEGVRGVVEAIAGHVAEVRIGGLPWKIEAWRLAPASV